MKKSYFNKICFFIFLIFFLLGVYLIADAYINTNSIEFAIPGITMALQGIALFWFGGSGLLIQYYLKNIEKKD